MIRFHFLISYSLIHEFMILGAIPRTTLVFEFDTVYIDFELDILIIVGGSTSPGPGKSCGDPAISPEWPMEAMEAMEAMEVLEARSGIINGIMTVPHSWPWQARSLYRIRNLF